MQPRKKQLQFETKLAFGGMEEYRAIKKREKRRRKRGKGRGQKFKHVADGGEKVGERQNLLTK